MSIFSLIRRGRQAAKEHKAQEAEKQKTEAEKAPYRHIPTHAALDALSGAPSGWRTDDRRRILEQNRRRMSSMASTPMQRSVSGTSSPVHMGMPRINSSLSYVTYPTTTASPLVQMQRTYSYGSMPPAFHDVVYTNVVEEGPLPPKSKGKEVERVAMVDSGRASRTSSKAHSPVGSCSDSSSSQDDLRMKPAKRAAPRASHSASHSVSSSKPPQAWARTEATPPGNLPHRLHPSRRLSDPPPVITNPNGQNLKPQQPRNMYYPPSTSSLRPPPARTMTAPAPAAGIPPVPALPQTPYIASSAMPSATASSASITVYPNRFVAGPARPASEAGATISPYEAFPDFVPVAQAVAEPAFSMSPSAATSKPARPVQPVQPAQPAQVAPSSRRSSKSAVPRFGRKEAVRSNAASPEPRYADAKEKKGRATVDVRALPTEFAQFAQFDFASAQPAAAAPAPAPQKANKLTKARSPPKAPMFSRNRWSLRSSRSAAVAG